MGKLNDLIGLKFGKWKVKKYLGHSYWLCQCKCGTIKAIKGSHLKNGQSKSCGCYRKEKITKIKTTHSLSHTKLYRVLNSMKMRCLNKNDKNYKYYGGRGITICQEWLEDKINFFEWAYANGYKEDLSIDRIDVNGNYEPSNCRWATRKEQSRNKRSNLLITYNGETHSLKEWSEILNKNYNTLHNRLYKLHWNIEEVLNTNIRNKKIVN